MKGRPNKKDIPKIVAYEVSFVRQAYKGLVEDAKQVLYRAEQIGKKLEALAETLDKEYPDPWKKERAEWKKYCKAKQKKENK